MLSPAATAATATTIVVLVALGHPGLAFLVAAGAGITIVTRLRSSDEQPHAERAGVDIDKAIATVERLARLGNTRRARGRKPRR